MLVCVLYFTVYVYVYVHCIQTNVYVPLYSAKGIDDVVLNKKIKFVWFGLHLSGLRKGFCFNF